MWLILNAIKFFPSAHLCAPMQKRMQSVKCDAHLNVHSVHGALHSISLKWAQIILIKQIFTELLPQLQTPLIHFSFSLKKIYSQQAPAPLK